MRAAIESQATTVRLLALGDRLGRKPRNEHPEVRPNSLGWRSLNKCSIPTNSPTDCYARGPMADAERRRLFDRADELHWRVGEPNKKGYVKLLCPCGNHKRWVHKTPSDPYYYLQALKWLERQPCSRGH